MPHYCCIPVSVYAVKYLFAYGYNEERGSSHELESRRIRLATNMESIRGEQTISSSGGQRSHGVGVKTSFLPLLSYCITQKKQLKRGGVLSASAPNKYGMRTTGGWGWIQGPSTLWLRKSCYPRSRFSKDRWKYIPNLNCISLAK